MKLLMSKNRKGRKQSKEHIENKAKSLREYYKKHPMIGDKNPHWKGGFYFKEGYKYIHSPDHPNKNNIGYIRENRLVMEKQIERYLTREEIVHHIDFNKNNNNIDNIDNLHLFNNNTEHNIYHQFLIRTVKEGLELQT
jgi:hypothetical protein